ncbi:unnamed protein product [Peniophora sp. CBMAI 1063]|nr:unnamed protein product [Peniophora sp. CBMAI 1063]
MALSVNQKPNRAPSYFTPARGFPEELVQYTVLIATEAGVPISLRRFQPYSWPLSLRRVCRAWKTAIDTYPRFWACVLASAEDQESWNMILSKTGISPLTVSTAYSVPTSAQVATLQRIGRMFIARDRAPMSWNDALTLAGCLPTLQILHLTRGSTFHLTASPLNLDAPNLRSLSLDCAGSLHAPLLHALKFTNVWKGFPSYLKDVIALCPTVRELVIDVPGCTEERMWDEIHVVLAGTPLTSIIIQLAGWARFASPPPVVVPDLRRLICNVPSPMTSCALEDFMVDGEISDILLMLRGMLSLLSLVVGLHVYGESDVAIQPTIPLLRCNKVVFSCNMGDHVVDILSKLNVPRILYVQLYLHLDTLSIYSPLLGPTVEVPRTPNGDVPDCADQTIDRRSMRKDTKQLQRLGPILQRMTDGRTSLHIHAKSDSWGMTTVDFRVRDNFIVKHDGQGLRITVTSHPPACHDKHRHFNLIPFAHVLSAFAWPSVTTVQLSSSNPGVPMVFSGGRMDPLATTFAEDGDLLQMNLYAMANVERLVVDITQESEKYGVGLFRALYHDEDRWVWPRLEHVELVAGTSTPRQGVWVEEISALLKHRNKVMVGNSRPNLTVVLGAEFGTAGWLDVMRRDIEGTGCFWVNCS